MKRITGIKVISFDGDGTLWDFHKVMRHSLRQVMKELKRIDPKTAAALDVDKMISIRNLVAERLKGEITNLEEVRLQAFRQTLKEIGRQNDILASHLNNVYLKHRFEDIKLFKDVLPALNSLRERHTLGILSNGNSYPERCGLEGIFRFAVFSQEYGVEKPDPTIFQITLEKAGCSRQHLLHVGDSLETDILGANRAGVSCVWLNRDSQKNSIGVKVIHEISSLQELPKMLR